MDTFYYICNFVNTAVKIWFVLQLAEGLFEAKVTRRKLYAAQAAMSVIVALIKCSNDIMYRVSFSNGMLIFMALLVAAGGKLLYKARVFDIFCLNMWGLILLALIDFYIQTRVYLGLAEQGMQRDLLLSVGVWRGAYLLATMLPLLPVGIKARKWLARWRRTVFKYRKQGIIFLLPMSVCTVYFQRIYIKRVSEDLLNHWGTFILGGLLLGFLFWIYTLKRRTDEEARLQQVRIEMLESNYLNLQKIHDEKGILIHDMKNHLYVIRDTLERGAVPEALEYVRQIIGKWEKSGNLICTHHDMLDLVLNRKLQEAQEAGIALSYEYDDMRGLKLTTMEICAMFANLLDNAIEANKRCPEGVEPRLDMGCRRRGNMLVVMMQNRMTKEAAGKGVEILEKTEKDNRKHGYGMRSIRKIVDSYGGDISAEIRDDMIRIRICLAAFGE